MNNENLPAHPVPSFADNSGYITYPLYGISAKQYAEIHLMAGLLANVEFVSTRNEMDIAEHAQRIVQACIQRIS